MPVTQDVPSSIDFSDIEQARAWVIDAVARRRSRPRFFQAFCAALNAHFDYPIRVVELGSGPGHLAREIVTNCIIESYFSIDFSPVMHALAREHLKHLTSHVQFVVADFREDGWSRNIGEVDALVTMQAAHEVRHKSRLPLLFRQIHDLVRPGGLFLYGDHYLETETKKNIDLHVTQEDQLSFLANAGFNPIDLLHNEEGLALYCAVKPKLSDDPRTR